MSNRPCVFGRIVSAVLIAICASVLAAASQHPLAYISNFNGNSVRLVDTVTDAVVATIPVGAGPIGVALSPGGGYALVANSLNGTASLIDTTFQKVVATIPVGKTPVAVAFLPNGARAYVTNQGDGTVSVINIALRMVTATATVGALPHSVAFSANGARAYVALASGKLVVLQTSNQAVLAKVNVPNAQAVAVGRYNDRVFVTSAPAGIAGSVYVISTKTFALAHKIPVKLQPRSAEISPDGLRLYVANKASNSVSVIDTIAEKVVATTPVGHAPVALAMTPNTTTVYVANSQSGSISEIRRSTSLVVDTFAGISTPRGIAMASASPVNQKITQPLSPTGINVFNFGSHSFKVAYPSGTSFSGVKMRVVAEQIPPDEFPQRVATSSFAKAICIPYAGAGDNCVIYQVSCTNTANNSVTCPTTGLPNITVLTSYDTAQPIVHPGFLHAPTGTDQWTNIFTEFFLQRVDPTTKGETTGFSDFVAVDLGGDDPDEPLSIFSGFLAPLAPAQSRVFPFGGNVPVRFRLTNQAGEAVTNSKARISVMSSGAIFPVQPINPFGIGNTCVYNSGPNNFAYDLDIRDYPRGTYTLTVYSSSFPAAQVTFKVQ